MIPFFAFPPEIRRVIYTTNALESVHAQLRKILKTRGHFPNDEAATKLIWLALRKFVRRSARELLVGEIQTAESRVQSLKSKVIAVGALLLAVMLVGWVTVAGDTANSGAFFGAGALVLIAGLNFISTWLARRTGFPLTPALSPSNGERENRIQSSGDAKASGVSFSLSSLAVGGCARRRKTATWLAQWASRPRG